MIYWDKRTDVLKHYYEVNKEVRHKEKQGTFNYRDINEYINANFIVLDDYEDEKELRSKMKVIELLKKEVDEIIQKYPEGHWWGIIYEYKHTKHKIK